MVLKQGIILMDGIHRVGYYWLNEFHTLGFYSLIGEEVK